MYQERQSAPQMRQQAPQMRQQQLVQHPSYQGHSYPQVRQPAPQMRQQPMGQQEMVQQQPYPDQSHPEVRQPTLQMGQQHRGQVRQQHPQMRQHQPQLRQQPMTQQGLEGGQYQRPMGQAPQQVGHQGQTVQPKILMDQTSGPQLGNQTQRPMPYTVVTVKQGLSHRHNQQHPLPLLTDYVKAQQPSKHEPRSAYRLWVKDNFHYFAKQHPTLDTEKLEGKMRYFWRSKLPESAKEEYKLKLRGHDPPRRAPIKVPPTTSNAVDAVKNGHRIKITPFTLWCQQRHQELAKTRSITLYEVTASSESVELWSRMTDQQQLPFIKEFHMTVPMENRPLLRTNLTNPLQPRLFDSFDEEEDGAPEQCEEIENVENRQTTPPPSAQGTSIIRHPQKPISPSRTMTEGSMAAVRASMGESSFGGNHMNPKISKFRHEANSLMLDQPDYGNPEETGEENDDVMEEDQEYHNEDNLGMGEGLGYENENGDYGQPGEYYEDDQYAPDMEYTDQDEVMDTPNEQDPNFYQETGESEDQYQNPEGDYMDYDYENPNPEYTDQHEAPEEEYDPNNFSDEHCDYGSNYQEPYLVENMDQLPDKPYCQNFAEKITVDQNLGSVDSGVHTVEEDEHYYENQESPNNSFPVLEGPYQEGPGGSLESQITVDQVHMDYEASRERVDQYKDWSVDISWDDNTGLETLEALKELEPETVVEQTEQDSRNELYFQEDLPVVQHKTYLERHFPRLDHYTMGTPYESFFDASPFWSRNQEEEEEMKKKGQQFDTTSDEFFKRMIQSSS